MKAPSSVKGCGGTGGLELRAVVPSGIPDGLFPPVDITVHSISTRRCSQRRAPTRGDSAIRGWVMYAESTGRMSQSVSNLLPIASVRGKMRPPHEMDRARRPAVPAPR